MLERIRNYELMFIISPLHASEEETQAIIDRVQQAITNADGEVTSVNHSSPWGRRKLAYPIRAHAGGEASRRNFTDGYYVLMHFSIASSKIASLERTLKLTDSILRHLITIVERVADDTEDLDDTDSEGDREESDRPDDQDQDQDQDQS